jgi:Protein of unknown function (DUF1553)/Protein of unknown function (DUF1549)/Concanavalin A-like lectin/glucanases superfamily/Planctomycete cytochrome C
MLVGFGMSAALWGAATSTVEFNRDVRPILSDRCFSCHGPDSAARKSPLRLDQEASARAVLKAGDPAHSPLYQRITSADIARRMPPAYMGHERLPDSEIETLRRWIEQGAEYQPHWSLIAPRRPAAPAVKESAWARNAIDGFVLARLEAEGIKHSPEADPATLLRRVTLDLTGLPPTPEETQSFVADRSPGAYERVVDRLLASPRYAERMAIRWLEAARYADTNGYQSDGPRDMWRWRDWVIDAFRNDMPFDRFTVEQIAGDLLPNATTSQKVATGFNRNHRTSAEGGIVDEEFRVDYVADRAATTATVWLGMTLGCARCHDHKYDPFTQKEFYQFFAYFNNTPDRGFVYNFGNEPPFIHAPLPDQERKLAEFDGKLAAAHAKLTAMEPAVEKAFAGWKPPADWNVRDGLIYEFAGPARFDGKDFRTESAKAPRLEYRDAFTFAARIRPETTQGAILSIGEDYFEGKGHGLYLVDGKLRLHITFRFSDLGMRVETVDALPAGKRQHVLVTYDGGMRAAGVHMYADGRELPLKVLFDYAIWPIETKEPLRIGAGGGLRFQGEIGEVRIYNRALSAREAAIVAMEDAAQRAATREAFLDLHAPAGYAAARAELKSLEAEKKKFLATVPTVMVMQEETPRRDTFLLKRGAYDAPGEIVEPHTPAVLPPFAPEWPADRLGLARWLVDRKNPLTARVTVNRFWQMLWGTGLVKTVEDFGSQGEWPLHPELLDWLAVEFMDSGWSVKHTVKTMVISATYRQASRVTAEMLERDPENRLFARGARYRLSPEMLRDQALAVSGLLVEKVGGPSVKPYQPPGLWQELFGGKGYEPDKGEGLYRRSLYTYWRRTIAPPAMMNFDSSSREVCVVRENRTNTPLQALNLMNDTIYLEAARKLAERIMANRDLAWGVQVVLGRAPRAKETEVLDGALTRFRAHYRAHPDDAAKFLSQGDAPRDPRLDVVELAAYTGVASLLLNMDEAVTRQ